MNTIDQRLRLGCLLILLLWFVSSCGSSSAGDDPGSDSLEKVIFQASFLPQGNVSFAAAYVAKEKGFFQDAGLDVTIQHSSPGGGEQMQLLATRQIQFITHTAPNFVKMMEGRGAPPFKAIALFGHESDHALMVLKEGPIKTVADLEGKRVAFKTGESVEPPWMLAMLAQADLTLEDVNLIPVGFDPRVILPDYGRGRVDAVQVFKSNEPNILRRAGFDVRLFTPEDFGIEFLGQVYVAHDALLRERPETVRKFLRGTFRGLHYMLEADPAEITDMIMRYAGPDADRDHNQFMWQTEIEEIDGGCAGEAGLGYACDREWTRMMEIMVEFGSLNEPVPIQKFWDPSFIQSIYDSEGNLIEF